MRILSNHCPRILGRYSTVTSGNERVLPIELPLSPSFFRNYDTLPDGRIVIVTEETARPQINLVLNWFEELKERVPVP